MLTKIYCLFFLILIGNYSFPQKYTNEINLMLNQKEEIKSIHPLFENNYPIVVFEGNDFHLYAFSTVEQKYLFIKKAPAPFNSPQKMRAAFPVDITDGLPACVVTPDVFSDKNGRAEIFHEFVHCYQYSTVELELKNLLRIYNEAMENEDWMWELNYPFPYQDKKIETLYFSFINELENSSDSSLKFRNDLSLNLVDVDFEYMVWQEWKEGTARYLENRIRNKLGLEENHFGGEEPFKRESFYEGGARLIDYLTKNNPELLLDLKELFFAIVEAE